MFILTRFIYLNFDFPFKLLTWFLDQNSIYADATGMYSFRGRRRNEPRLVKIKISNILWPHNLVIVASSFIHRDPLFAFLSCLEN